MGERFLLHLMMRLVEAVFPFKGRKFNRAVAKSGQAN